MNARPALPAPAAPANEAELDELLSRPAPSLAAALASVPGTIVILGAGGKMGPSLARMAKRADPSRRVIAVSRWSNANTVRELESHGVETATADLLHPAQLAALPDAANVVFMAGQKFGTSERPSVTWAMNAVVPAFAAERYTGVRTVVFSTGNVYPLSLATGPGSSEGDAPGPIGEYASSCLARERIFESAATRHDTPVSIVRLNYAHDLRYGVLTDIAARIVALQPVELTMGHVNVLWQGDANALALAALTRASSDTPYIVNVAGPEVLHVAALASALGRRLGVSPVLTGVAAPDALLSDSSRMSELLGDPLLPLETLLDWVATWVQRGGRLLGKPTAFERRDGRF